MKLKIIVWLKIWVYWNYCLLCSICATFTAAPSAVCVKIWHCAANEEMNMTFSNSAVKPKGSVRYKDLYNKYFWIQIKVFCLLCINISCYFSVGLFFAALIQHNMWLPSALTNLRDSAQGNAYKFGATVNWVWWRDRVLWRELCISFCATESVLEV